MNIDAACYIFNNIIKHNTKIPIFHNINPVAVSSGAPSATPTIDTVELRELALCVQNYIKKLECENTVLKKDLHRVCSNGSIRWFADEYYSNFSAVEESDAIFKKHFPEEK